MIEGKKKKKEREIVRLITQVGNFIDHPVDVCIFNGACASLMTVQSHK